MKRPSKWTQIVIALLIAIGVFELAATLSDDPKPRTISEILASWFPKKVRRALLVGLFALLTWHFWSQPDIKPVDLVEVIE